MESIKDYESFDKGSSPLFPANREGDNNRTSE